MGNRGSTTLLSCLKWPILVTFLDHFLVVIFGVNNYDFGSKKVSKKTLKWVIFGSFLDPIFGVNNYDFGSKKRGPKRAKKRAKNDPFLGQKMGPFLDPFLDHFLDHFFCVCLYFRRQMRAYLGKTWKEGAKKGPQKVPFLAKKGKTVIGHLSCNTLPL